VRGHTGKVFIVGTTVGKWFWVVIKQSFMFPQYGSDMAADGRGANMAIRRKRTTVVDVSWPPHWSALRSFSAGLVAR